MQFAQRVFDHCSPGIRSRRRVDALCIALNYRRPPALAVEIHVLVRDRFLKLGEVGAPGLERQVDRLRARPPDQSGHQQHGRQ
jgi:hypothetical protein